MGATCQKAGVRAWGFAIQQHLSRQIRGEMRTCFARRRPDKNSTAASVEMASPASAAGSEVSTLRQADALACCLPNRTQTKLSTKLSVLPPVGPNSTPPLSPRTGMLRKAQREVLRLLLARGGVQHAQQAREVRQRGERHTTQVVAPHRRAPPRRLSTVNTLLSKVKVRLSAPGG